MNREMKFRAWDGDTMWYQDIVSFTFGRNATKESKKYWSCYTYDDDFVCDNAEESVIMQFIGLLDKNGKEIYEGDIVTLRRNMNDESIYTTGVVEFSSGCFWIRGDGYAEVQHWHFNDSDREIIGNVYENPELVKK